MSDMGNCAHRLHRCRNLPLMRPAPKADAAVSSINVDKELQNMNAKRKFHLARDHFTHRMYAVQAQLQAYKRWAEIEEKALAERTPGEEHYTICMEQWESQYKPFHAHLDYEGDAALMLFDMDMTYHDQAAQALMSLEEQRRLRQPRTSASMGATAKSIQESLANALKAPPRPPAHPAVSGRKRPIVAPQRTAVEHHDDLFDCNNKPVGHRSSTPVSKKPRPNHENEGAKSAPASPEKNTEHIVCDASL